MPDRKPLAFPNITTHQARPVLHVDDAVRATLELMAAPAGAVRDKRSYNITGASLSPQELGQELRDTYPFREIDVWNLPDHPGPVSLDDSAARTDWGWKPRYDLLGLIKTLMNTNAESQLP